MQPQSTVTLQDIYDSYREVARLQRIALEANRAAQKAAARSRDLTLQFCVDAGVTITMVEQQLQEQITDDDGK